MKKQQAAAETHRSVHIGWLRAAVLGANDGIVSTASLIVGVAAANSSHQSILVAGAAGLVAGAMSMACGEYVSVCSQADTEQADLAKEKKELATNPEGEHEELTQIYIQRGLDPDLASKVAEQLTMHDALGTHARDELGITEIQKPRPIQAAFASALSFSVGAMLPLAIVFVSNTQNIVSLVFVASILSLIILGLIAAKIGGAKMWRGALRVAFWGSLAMFVTGGIGSMFGTN